MKVNDHIDMKGRLRIQLRNASDEIVQDFKANNSIVQTGRELVATQFINQPIDPVSHIAVGTGATPNSEPPTDVALEAELFRKEINDIDPTIDVTTTVDQKVKVLITTELGFNEGNGDLTEAGLFNSDSPSNANDRMYNRVVFPAVSKTSDFKLTLIWEIIF